MSKQIFFISLISRDNRPLHIQSISPLKGVDVILSERVDEQTGAEQGNEFNATKTQNTPDKKVGGGGGGDTLVNDINDNEILQYHFLSNMALDIYLSPFYEGEQGMPSLLFIQDGINVYGYETNTGLKILVGTSSEIDQSFEYIFKSLHRLYLELIVNPFQNDDLSKIKINHKTTSIKISKIITEWEVKYNTISE